MVSPIKSHPKEKPKWPVSRNRQFREAHRYIPLQIEGMRDDGRSPETEILSTVTFRLNLLHARCYFYLCELKKVVQLPDLLRKCRLNLGQFALLRFCKFIQPARRLGRSRRARSRASGCGGSEFRKRRSSG